MEKYHTKSFLEKAFTETKGLLNLSLCASKCLHVKVHFFDIWNTKFN